MARMGWVHLKLLGMMLLSAEGILLLPRLFDPQHRLHSFMKKHDLTSASIAYGQVDQAPQWMTVNANPKKIYPYASLSKPITASFFLSLAEGNRSSLDASVAGTTPRDLLRHTAGWDRGVAGDPVTNKGRTGRCIDIPLPPRQYRPGTKQIYSNVGYCVLGRLIEDQTGQSYAAAVRARIPETRSMQYDERLGPAGGWSGSALTYWSFAIHAHDPLDTKKPAFLGQEYYGLGWKITPAGLSHFGLLEGQFSVALRQGDFVAVALFDGAPADGWEALKEIRPMLLDLQQRNRR